MSDFDVVVVGAGSAGLGVGYHLRQAGIDFVILERGEIGESWRSQRWDSFTVNTPNRINGLAGSPYDGDDPEGYLSRAELVESFEHHATRHGLPIRTHTAVKAMSRDGDGFVLQTTGPDGVARPIRAGAVVASSGGQRNPRIPKISAQVPTSVTQMHSADYRSPDGVPEGAVVVVGSGQSGCQIVEDLLEAGRTVYLCTSRVARVPRRYRGRDVIDWMNVLHLWDQTVSDLEDPMMQYAAQPQVSGVGPRGHTVSLQGLQRRGVTLMGRLTGVADGVLTTDDSLADHVGFADGFSAQLKEGVDAFLAAQGIDAPPPEDEPEDRPAGPEVVAAGRTALDLAEAGVSTVIWCTGFGGDFGWLGDVPMDDRGMPVHTRGVAPIPGLYYLGFPWLHTRKSGILYGIDEDARHVVEAIGDRLARMGGRQR